MAVQPTQGHVFGFAAETALGTNAGTFSYIRVEPDSIAYTHNPTTLLANENDGHRHAAKKDKPIPIEVYKEDDLKFGVKIRRAAAANTDPFICKALESAGWSADRTTVTDVSSYSSTIAWSLGDTGDAYGTVGEYILVKLEDSGDTTLDELYFPSLIADKTGDAVVPAVALPAATANAEPIEPMTTCWPISRAVPATKTLSFRDYTRGNYTGTEDLSFEMKGCSLKSVGTISLEINQPPVFSLGFSYADQDAEAVAIPAETLVDSEKFAVLTHSCRCAIVNASAAGGVARTDVILRKADIELGLSSINRVGYGTSACINGTDGYMTVIESAKITITVDFDKSILDEVAGDNTSKLIEIAQPTSSLATPAFAFCLPNCHLDPDTPVDKVEDGNMIHMTATYIGDCAGFDSEVDNDEPGASPFYMAISGASS